MITQLDMCYLINQWFYNEFAIYFIKKKKKPVMKYIFIEWLWTVHHKEYMDLVLVNLRRNKITSLWFLVRI